MKNVIAGMMFLGLLGAGWAEPVEPALTPSSPEVTVLKLEQQKTPESPVLVAPKPQPAPMRLVKAPKQQPPKVKEPLEIKLQGF